MTPDHHALICADEHIREWRRATFPPFASMGVFNINSLDPDDARGVEEVIDLDRADAIRDDELIEKLPGEE